MIAATKIPLKRFCRYSYRILIAMMASYAPTVFAVERQPGGPLPLPEEVAVFKASQINLSDDQTLNKLFAKIKSISRSERFQEKRWLQVNRILNATKSTNDAEFMLYLPAGINPPSDDTSFDKYADGYIVLINRQVDFEKAVQNSYRFLTGNILSESLIESAIALNRHVHDKPQLQRGDLIFVPTRLKSATGDAVVTTVEPSPQTSAPSPSPSMVPEEKSVAGDEKSDKSSLSQQEESAWEFSFFDSLKPGMEGMLSGIGKKTAAGYVGLRYGLSLADESSGLMSDVSVVGLLLEMRSPPIDGLRFYWDYVPRVSNGETTEELHAEWSRITLAWAFAIPVPMLVDTVHVTPKIGSYTLDTRLPVSTIGEETVARDLKISSALGLGLEIDAEIARYFYIVRGWAAHDISGRDIGLDQDESIISTRFGIDAFVKGGGFTLFGARLSLQWLLYATAEELELRGRSEESGSFSVKVSIPHAGAGISLGW